MSLEIYWGSGSPFAWRVLLTAELKGVPYVSKQLEFSKKEHKADSYLLLNPRGEVPTLKDGVTILTESIAIMTYLDMKFPSPPLFGSTPIETARIWSWISIAMYHYEAMSNRLVVPIFEKTVHQCADDMRSAAVLLHNEWSGLEKALSTNACVVGDSISAADIVIFTYLAFLLRIVGREIVTPLDLGFHPMATRYPSISAWCRRIEKIKGYDNAFPPHWRT